MNVCATAALEKSARRYEPGKEVESFYHLIGKELKSCPCQGTACFVARNSAGKKHPQDSPRVYCLGRCFEAPAAGVSEVRPNVEVCSRETIVLKRLARGGARSFESYRRTGGYLALEKALTMGSAELLRQVEDSGLRGRGGAGYPTGRKWSSVAGQSVTPKYVIANADEGDPGAYIDRFLLEGDPHSVLEGMLLAAYATGASRGWIYLRHEYPLAKEIVESAIAEARSEGLLGKNILGSRFNFDVEVYVGHGSYVCGEEMALLNSLAGKRPEVLARPPYPTERGLFGYPTLINNVETLVTIPWIAEHGGDAYRQIGFSRSRGTKVVSLNSLFRKPGLYEVEFGIPVRRIVEDYGGGLRSGEIKGVIIGGPLAGIIPPSLFDTEFGFEELEAIGGAVGHGGVVAFDTHTSIPALVHHVFSFGAYESCGKCTPCRLGSQSIESVLADALRGTAPREFEAADFNRLVTALKTASLCGHGTGLASFAESVLRYYGKELATCFT